MELTEKQLGILRDMLRNQFEMLDLKDWGFIINKDNAIDLIQVAEKFGLTDLANEMRQDLEGAAYDFQNPKNAA